MKQYDGIKDEELISRFKNGGIRNPRLSDGKIQEHGPQESKDHVPDRRGER